MATPAVEFTDVRDIEGLWLQGLQFFRANAWQQALVCLNAVACARPDDAEVHNYCARALESLDRREEALTCLDRALAINPKNIADLRNRAVVLTKLGRAIDALPDYDAAISLGTR